MGTSDITITALTATPSLRGNKLAAALSISGPAQNIPGLQIDTIEFSSSITNDRATATVVVTGYPEAIHEGLIEEQTYYYWARAKNKFGDYGTYYPVSATAGVACTAIGMSGLAFGLANGKIVASVAANALTVAIKTAAGNDPSASDPIYLAFPNATLTAGNYQIRQISAALSLTVSNGSTLGLLVTGTAFRLWLIVFDDAGTLRLGICLRSYAGGTVLPLVDGVAQSSTAEGGAGGADGTLIYTTVAVTTKPYRVIGYLEWTTGIASLGVWASAPDVVRLAAPGFRPNSVIPQYFTQDGVVGGGSTLIPGDNTTPQKTEGAAWGTTPSITPFSPANWFEIDLLMNLSHSVASEVIVAVFRDSESDAIGCGVGYCVAGEPTQVRVKFRVLVGTSADRTFSVRAGGVNAGTLTFDGWGGAAKLNGTLMEHLSINEIVG